MIETKTPHLQGPRIRVEVAEASGFKHIAVKRLTPVIGAEIGGISLADGLEDRKSVV